jgi:hypothetical protein
MNSFDDKNINELKYLFKLNIKHQKKYNCKFKINIKCIVKIINNFFLTISHLQLVNYFLFFNIYFRFSFISTSNNPLTFIFISLKEYRILFTYQFQ